jgi:hypothetical protein
VKLVKLELVKSVKVKLLLLVDVVIRYLRQSHIGVCVLIKCSFKIDIFLFDCPLNTQTLFDILDFSNIQVKRCKLQAIYRSTRQASPGGFYLIRESFSLAKAILVEPLTGSIPA